MKSKIFLTAVTWVAAVSFGLAEEPADETPEAAASEAAADETALWTTDLAAAQARAREESKPIFIYFTGSDWCGWCIRLDREVLSQEAFTAYASEHLVLLEVDFPRRDENKAKQSAELIAQNRGLDRRFGIEGYPTVFLTDADLEQLAETGYRQGGPEAYVEHLKQLLAEKPAADE